MADIKPSSIKPSLLQLQDDKGRLIRLGQLIKSGGAGSVYHIQNANGQVAKIYHDKIDKPLHQRKILAMLSLRPKLPPVSIVYPSSINQKGINQHGEIVQLAWPLAQLFDNRKQFIGFLMPELDVKNTIELEYILQERQARANNLPVGLGAKVSLAANLATLVAALHLQHHRVVDMKPLNLRFYRESLYMAMLDCDGFSIQGRNERFPAGQFTVEYLAPEFQTLQNVAQDQEEWQDRFSLAVILFQLLNFGIHPFSGRPLRKDVPTDIPGRIAKNCYPYGRKASLLIAPHPVSGHSMMPDSLRLLFDRAFSGPPSQRPSAQEWADFLLPFATRSTQNLRVCSKNSEHQFFAGLACAACARDNLVNKATIAQQQQTPVGQQGRNNKKKKNNRTKTGRRPAMTSARQPAQQRQPQPQVQTTPSQFKKIPSAVWRTLFAALFAFILAYITQLVISTGAEVFNLNKALNSFFNEPYIDQFALGLVSVSTLMIILMIVLFFLVLPFWLISAKKP